ncbi:MAG: CCA tRNA nucleotidyltransferase [Oscillochloris sp.]|nr:CCA tRNA nucleotidyltransferase [Oscillochloris sp.]
MLPLNTGSVKLAPAPPSTPPTDLLRTLPPDLARLLAQVALIAARQGARLWLVGGVVRDLLLGLPPDRDVDLAIEGETAQLAVSLAKALGGRVLASHRTFATATIALPRPAPPSGELLLDLARARVEAYPQPAALPQVRPASIVEDLQRRDFSLNAIALELRVDGEQLGAGDLLDPSHGWADLAQGRLRLLHPLSLRDDPTRILRGLRLAARLGLQPEPDTAALIADALAQGYLGLLTPERILTELCLTLEESQPAAVLALADAWGVTPQLVPGLHWSLELAARFTRYAESELRPPAPGPLAAGLLCYDLSPDDLATLPQRYPLPTPVAQLLGDVARLPQLAQRLCADLSPSKIDLLLRPHSESAIYVLHFAASEEVSRITFHYLRMIRSARPPLDGRDLQRLGVAPGPAIGRMLADLRAAYLDGTCQTREQAEQWVGRQLGRA